MKDYSTFRAIGDMFAIYFVVIVISLLVAFIVRGMANFLSKQAEQQAANAPLPMAKPASAPVIAAGVPQEHIVAISAAVASMMGAHRIVHIEGADRGHGWTSEARSSHHTSHLPHH